MDTNVNEIWLDIAALCGQYKVSNYGRVINSKSNFILRPSKDKDGYLFYSIRPEGEKSTTFRAHRLVAICFIENIGSKLEVNHIDGNKENNYVGNLEWCTRSENQIHAYQTGLQKRPFGVDNHRHKKAKDAVTGKTYDCIKSAAEDIGVNYHTLKTYLQGRAKNKTNIVLI